MTIGVWILFGFLTVTIALFAGALCFSVDVKYLIFIVVFAAILIALTFCGIHWWCTSTEAGQRAMKSQQSNLDGGLNRTVTVYGYSGDEIKSWTGKFDVTENDQETWFDIDGRRLIIQGGIIINEEVEDKSER